VKTATVLFIKEKEREAWCKSMASLFTVIPGEISIYQKFNLYKKSSKKSTSTMVYPKAHQHRKSSKNQPANKMAKRYWSPFLATVKYLLDKTF
jgi:hypothetical protein